MWYNSYMKDILKGLLGWCLALSLAALIIWVCISILNVFGIVVGLIIIYFLFK